jgi:hypothetical protein
VSGIQTTYGKAYEYACLLSLYNTLSSTQEVIVETSPQLETACGFYEAVTHELRSKLNQAANAAVRVIIRLEPQLENPNKSIPLFLSLQTDAKGIAGDVRDVLCLRKQNEWEIGLSCKHNHHALKHSRLSDTIDFGLEWFGIPCGESYFNAVVPLFSQLRDLRDSTNNTALWKDISNKSDVYYVPILQAFMDELLRLDAENPQTIPQQLIRYLVGKNDFYKVITNDRKHTTRVEAINLSGTLNRLSGTHRSIVNVAKLKLPTQFYRVSFSNNSKTTILIACDAGWTVSLRIHNASSRIEPSLKFDVNLISLPNTLYAQDEPWSS